MKKLINTKGTEFEQNGKDLAIIDTDQRGGIPIMLDSADLDAGIINGDSDALDKISVDVDNEPEVEVTPTTEDQTVTPGDEYTGLSRVTVKGVTSDVDSNIQPENILKGVDILGVTGTAKTTAYVLEDSNNYNTDANKATILQIKQDISDGKEPLVYLHSRYANQGWGTEPTRYYICAITDNADTNISFKTVIPIIETNGAVTKNGVTYNHLSILNVWFTLADGVVTNVGNNVQRMPYPTLSFEDASPLGMRNTSVYEPTGDYNPATKKYVDDSIEAIPGPDLSNYYTKAQTEAVIKGDIPIYKVQYTGAIPSNNYSVIYSTQRINEILADVWSKGYKTFGLFMEILTDTTQGTRISVLLMPITGNDWTTSTISRPVIFQGITQRTQGAYDTDLLKVSVLINPTYHQDSAPTTSEFYIYGKSLDFMLRSNTTNFTPTNNYQPTTKKYVDDAISGAVSSLVIGATHSRLGTDATNSWWVHDYNINTEVGNNALGTLANVVLNVYNDCISFIKDINLTHLIRIHTLDDVLLEWKFGDSTSWSPKTYRSYVNVFYKNSGLIAKRAVYANPNLRADGTIESWYNFDWGDTTLTALGVANTTAYTPTADYHPATKKYVDDNAGGSVYEFDLRKYYAENFAHWPELPDNTYRSVDVTTADGTLCDALLADVKAGKMPQVMFRCFSYIGDNNMMYNESSMIVPAAIMPYVSEQPTINNDCSFCYCFAMLPMYLSGNGVSPEFPSGQIIKLDLTRKKVQISCYNNKLPASKEQVLTKDNTVSFTPTADYHPATKKYVDDTVAGAGGGDSDSFFIKLTTTSRLFSGKNLSLNSTDKAAFSPIYEYIDTNNKLPNIIIASSAMYNTPSSYLHITGYRKEGDYSISLYGYSFTTETNSDEDFGTAKLAAISEYRLEVRRSDTTSYTISSITMNNYRGEYLSASNTTAFTPTGDYNPATKKYVDDAISNIPTPSGGIPTLSLQNTSFNFEQNTEGSLDSGDLTAIKNFVTSNSITIDGTETPLYISIPGNNVWQSKLFPATIAISEGTTKVLAIKAIAFSGAFAYVFSIQIQYSSDISSPAFQSWSCAELGYASAISALDDVINNRDDIDIDRFSVDSNLSYASDLSIDAVDNCYIVNGTGEINLNIAVSNGGTDSRSGLCLVAELDDSADTPQVIQLLPTLRGGETTLISGRYKIDDYDWENHGVTSLTITENE